MSPATIGTASTAAVAIIHALASGNPAPTGPANPLPPKGPTP